MVMDSYAGWSLNSWKESLDSPLFKQKPGTRAALIFISCEWRYINLSLFFIFWRNLSPFGICIQFHFHSKYRYISALFVNMGTRWVLGHMLTNFLWNFVCLFLVKHHLYVVILCNESDNIDCILSLLQFLQVCWLPFMTKLVAFGCKCHGREFFCSLLYFGDPLNVRIRFSCSKLQECQICFSECS